MNELTDEQIDALLVLHGKGDDGFHSFARGAIAADRALQASRVAVPATDGWVLVPLEPTAEMLQAGQDTPVSESDEDAPEDYKAVYRAMLAAAPRHHQAAHVPTTDVQAELQKLENMDDEPSGFIARRWGIQEQRGSDD